MDLNTRLMQSSAWLLTRRDVDGGIVDIDIFNVGSKVSSLVLLVPVHVVGGGVEHEAIFTCTSSWAVE